MLELIAIIIFIISIFGIGIILYKKIPVLVELPITEQGQQDLVSLVKIKIQALNLPSKFNFRKLLKKFFKESHIFIFKIENKAGYSLEKMRKKRTEKNQLFEKQSQDNVTTNDNYWKEIKKHKEKNNNNLPK